MNETDVFFDYFPWDDYRCQQKKAIEQIANAIEKKENIMFRAPCGFGKSVTTITAALKNKKKVILLTPNH